VNAESIGIGYAVLQKYWYWYCNTFKKIVLVLVLAILFQAVLVLVLPILFNSIVNNPGWWHNGVHRTYKTLSKYVCKCDFNNTWQTHMQLWNYWQWGL